MKNILKTILGIINTIYIAIFKNINQKKSFFYLSKFSVHSNNNLYFSHSKILNTKFFIKGRRNYISAEESLISGCQINISGEGNKLVLEEGVKLRNAIIHIRGKNCIIRIGKETSTGGIRIVNVGTDNTIEIGEGCLFADFIEIWASDTHSILDENDKVINQEKPIKIGNNVWVGSHVKILKGVTIEDWAIIGMGALVVSDVPKNSISIGFPNKVIKNNVKWTLEY